MKSNLEVIKSAISLIAAVTIVGSGYFLYRNNIWIPQVDVIKYDPQVGAVVVVNAKKMIVKENQTIHAGGMWGVRLSGDDEQITRLELLKNNLVYKTYQLN